MLVRAMRWIFNILYVLLTRRRVSGLENLPARGPYILAANHLSIFDVPLLFGLIGGEHVTGWAGEKWASNPLIAAIVRAGKGIFIQRGEVDRSALKAAKRWLEAGNVFGMAPEGTRSKTGGLIRAKLGVAYLAELSAAPVIPIAVTGNENLIRSWLRLRRPLVTVRFGQPLHFPPVPRAERSTALQRNTDEIMCQIAAMLPGSYRGVYADHQRLLELLGDRVN